MIYIPGSDDKKYDIVLQPSNSFEDLIILWSGIDIALAKQIMPLINITFGNLYIVDHDDAIKIKQTK